MFDKIFSEQDASGVRQYKIPYPFQALVSRLQAAAGGVAPVQTIFAMGRSLQRVAAIAGMKVVPNVDPFFRFPRIVIGFDQESRNAPDRLNLNLKGRLFVGMNEKAQLLEAISYNDEAGRFEYQIVRNYAQGTTPQVVYANRQLCLTCHQNQTPIFSQGPWQESNANTAMSDGMIRVMRAQLGDRPCPSQGYSVFCNDNGHYRYFGAPVAVDISAPQAIDKVTKAANLFPAYHKMWQRLCPDSDCRKNLLKQILLYKLVGGKQLLLTADLQKFNALLQQRWSEQFPNGMAIPDASIRNRDPLVNVNERGQQDLSVIGGKSVQVKDALHDVISNSNIPSEFEPARPRPPLMPPWTSPFLDPDLSVGNAINPQQGVARLIAGYADFFTSSDARWVDDILVSKPADEVENIPGDCQLSKGATNGYTIKCQFSAQGRITFSAFVRPDAATSDYVGTASLLRVRPIQPDCDPGVIASPVNLANGTACPQIENVTARLHMQGTQGTLSFRTSSGLSVRILDGRRLASVGFNWPDQAAMALTFNLVHDLGPLAKALDQAYASPDNTADKTGGFLRFVKGPALNRNAIMAMVMRYLGQPHDELFNLTNEMSSLKRISEAPDDEITQVENLAPIDKARALAMHNCGVCHFNIDNVPPAYLGGPGENVSPHDRCARLSTCSPRMLYRLKMWECDASDYGPQGKKKSPMPPMGRLKALGVDIDTWKAKDRVQLFQALQAVFPKAELPGVLTASGLSPADAAAITSELQTLGCEPRTSDIFEKLPDCDDKIPIDTKECRF